MKTATHKVVPVNSGLKIAEVKMAHVKSTKNTFVFGAIEDDAVVPTLYVKKDAFPDGIAPTYIKITLEKR